MAEATDLHPAMTLKQIAVRVIAAVPGWAWRPFLLARQHSRLIRRVSEGVSGRLRGTVFLVRHGPAKGLRIDTSEGKLGYVLGENEARVQEAMVKHLRPAAVFYDVGANIGFFTLLAARIVGTEGQVYAFEPQPRIAEALRANVALNGFGNVRVTEIAAHSKEGWAELDISEPIEARLVTEPAHDTLRVRLQRLDDLKIHPPDVVKIDVEGAEKHVLAGMERILAAHRPIIIAETHGPQDEFLQRLDAAGYAVTTLDDGQGFENPHIIATPR